MSAPRREGPPRLAEWIAGLRLPESVRDPVLGDLEEQFRHRSLGSGRLRALLWYGRQLAAILYPPTRARLLAAFAEETRPVEPLGLGALRDDVGQAVRSTLRRPLVPAAVALMAALGIAVASSVFTVVHSVLLRPLPYPDPDRLVRMVLDHRAYPPSVTALNLLDLNDLAAARTLTAVSGYTGAAGRTLTGEGEPVRLSVTQVLEDFERVLGVAPAAGRLLHAGDFAEGAERVVVVSHRVWSTHLGGRPEVVGSTVLLDDRPTRVVGVLPPTDFEYPADADLWEPLLALQPWQQERSSLWLEAVARVRPGATLAAAQTEVDGIMARLGAAFPSTNQERGVRLLPLQDEVVGPTRPMLGLLSGATALMVLVACVNVSLLLLVRARDRRPELALRSSLGGGARIRRQLFGEVALMAGMGGALGMALTPLVVRALLRLDPDLPRAPEVHVDLPVLALAMGALLLVTVLGGVAPAREAKRADPAAALRGGLGRLSRREHVTGSLLIGTQIALAVTLLAGAGLMMRTLVGLGRVDLGFDASAVVAFNVAPPAARYRTSGEVRALYDALLREIEAVPGVEVAGSVNNVPFGSSEWSMEASFEALADVPEERRPRAGIQLVHPGYFRALDVPLVAGRLPGPADDADAPGVAVVSEGLATSVFGEPRAALGQPLRFLDRTVTVVGVVADVRRTSLRSDDEHELYISSLQHFERTSHVVVRADGDAGALVPALREAVHRVDPLLALDGIATLDARVARSVAPERLRAVLVGAFAGVSLLLAALGVYGMVTYEAIRRRREMAVRLSVGAAPAGILGAVVGRTLRTATIGAAAGAVAAWLLGRWVEGLVFGVDGRDPSTLFGAAAALVLVAGAAAFRPALLASRTDPATALRED